MENKPKWLIEAEGYEAALYEFLEDPYIDWGRLGDNTI